MSVFRISGANHKKLLIDILIAVSMLLLLTGCGEAEGNKSNSAVKTEPEKPVSSQNKEKQPYTGNWIFEYKNGDYEYNLGFALFEDGSCWGEWNELEDAETGTWERYEMSGKYKMVGSKENLQEPEEETGPYYFYYNETTDKISTIFDAGVVFDLKRVG